MLYEFLTRERSKILEVAKRKALETRWGKLTSDSFEKGWGTFYDELTGHLVRTRSLEGQLAPVIRETDTPSPSGKDYMRLGYAITEAVQSYNFIHQAITDAAEQLGFAITPEELEQLNLSLDVAIAEVVIEFEKLQTEAHGLKETERLGFLAHELRNCIQSATLSLDLIKSGAVGISGKTGAVLERSLERMAILIDTALASVRLEMEPAAVLKLARLCDILTEVEVTANFQARTRSMYIEINCAAELEAMVDRHLIVSALSNLVQNALKFSKPGGKVSVHVSIDEDWIYVGVEDECGGLPLGVAEDLFTPGVQKGDDRSGVGLGLAISRQAIERNHGTLRVENLPGKGCKFIVALPRVKKMTASSMVEVS